MRSVNKVILIGNLTRDPEVRQTPNGQSVTTFGIATNREWVTRDSQHHTSSEYHEIVAWSRLAEICGQFLKKGKLVYIEGYLKTRSWDTPEGVKKFKTEIVIQDMIMLEKRQPNGDAGDAEQADYIPEEGVQENHQEPQREQQQMEKPRREPTRHEPTRHQEVKNYTNAEPAKPVEHKEPVAAAPAKTPVESGPIDIDQDLGL